MAITFINPFILFPPTGGAFSPSDISNLVSWWDADAITGLNDDDNIGGAGSEWEDLSGNGYDLSQGTSTYQPKYKTNIQNSKPAVLFDGTNDFLRNYDHSRASQPWTFYFCIDTFSDAAQYLFDHVDDASGWTTAFRPVAGSYFSMYAGTQQNFTAWTTSPCIVAFVSNGASSFCRLNGSNSSTADTGSLDAELITLGADYQGNYPFNGYMFEVIAYNKALSSSELSDVDTYLSDKWGISI